MFEIDNISILIFLCFFLQGIALFQTLLFSAISKFKIKPGYLLFLLNPLFLIISYFIDGKLAAWVFIISFASVFLLGIILMIKSALQSGFAYVQNERKKKKSYLIIGLQIVLGLIFLAIFPLLGQYSFILIILIVLTIFLTKKNSRFFRLQGILATSKIQSLAMGLVEIIGKTKAIDPVFSTYTSTSCIGYIYTIEEISYHRDKDGDTTKKYSQIHYEKKGNDFEVSDETGTVTVSFENLDFVSIEAGSTETGKKRYSEILLKEGMEVLIIGNANTDKGVPFIEYSKSHKVFGISPVGEIDFYNKFKPLRTQLTRSFLSFVFITATILFLPIKHENNKIIFDEIDYNPIEYLKVNFFGKTKASAPTEDWGLKEEVLEPEEYEIKFKEDDGEAEEYEMIIEEGVPEEELDIEVPILIENIYTEE